MTQLQSVKAMTDNDLSERLAIDLMAWREDEHPEVNGTGQWMAEYEYGVYYKSDGTYVQSLHWDPCDDLENAMEVQAKAIEVDNENYLSNLHEILLGSPYVQSGLISVIEISKLLQATPRQRSEAAYLTIKFQP